MWFKLWNKIQQTVVRAMAHESLLQTAHVKQPLWVPIADGKKDSNYVARMWNGLNWLRIVSSRGLWYKRCKFNHKSYTSLV
jgi:hypothetical protein